MDLKLQEAGEKEHEYVGIQLPSAHQIGDCVRVEGVKGQHRIDAVTFTKEKVLYEVRGILYQSEHIKKQLKIVTA